MKSSLMSAVEEVARLAGGIALRAFQSELAVELKPDGSEVTAADRAAERAARHLIEQRFPDDGILGEEFGETKPGAKRRWIIDPIDGTKSFIRGVPFWGTLVAVAEGEKVLAGAIFCPTLDEIAVAATGEGCWWNGKRAQVSRVDSMERATVREFGDCHSYLLVATGRAEVMIDRVLSPWDAAALLPVITEAGGVFTDLSGRVTAFGGSAVATNAALARVARETLGAVAP